MSRSGYSLAAFLICFTCCCCVSAQDKPARLTYDIVSVRPSDPKLPSGQINPIPNGIGYNAVRVTVKDMLSVMYRIPRRQITGGPDWLGTERFDVTGRTERVSSVDDLHVMFEHLLEDRFKLKLHTVTVMGPVYVLTVAKSGLKMTRVEAGSDRHNPIVTVAGNRFLGDRVPVNYLCFWLGQNLQNDQRPVIDRTGLAGTYSFNLSFKPQLRLSEEDESTDDDLPSIFQALREQLGLELTAQRGPVQRLIVESIERPSDN